MSQHTASTVRLGFSRLFANTVQTDCIHGITFKNNSLSVDTELQIDCNHEITFRNNNSLSFELQTDCDHGITFRNNNSLSFDTELQTDCDHGITFRTDSLCFDTELTGPLQKAGPGVHHW